MGSRTTHRIGGLVVALALAVPVVGGQTEPVRADGSFHLPSSADTDKTIDFTVTGADVRQVPGAPEGTYEGTVTGDAVTISGSGTFKMGENLVTYLSMNATLSADGESVNHHWPQTGGSETVYGPLDWTQSFSLTLPVTKGVTRNVSFSVEVRNCGDWVCGAVGGSGTLTGWAALCPEAEAFFLDQAATFTKGNMRASYDALLAQLQSAIDAWEAETGAKATMSTGGEPVAAGMWLFSDGAVPQADYVKMFGFGPDPFSRNGQKVLEDVQDAMQSGAFWDGTYQPYAGSEADLAQTIVLTSTAQGRPLNPGDVYRLAMSKTGGDTRRAALLAHNTLKSLARQGTIWQTGLLPTPSFFSTYLTTLRDGDNAGVWYHTFGTMYYQLEIAQSVSLSSRIVSAAGIGGAGLLYIPSWLFTNASDYFLGWKKPFRFQQMLEGIINGGLSPEATGWSTFSNAAEQAFREIGTQRDPDPEKFCFNVWGTQLAEAIRRRLFPTPPLQIFDTTRTNPYSNVAGDTRTLDPPNTSGRPDLGPWDPTQPMPKLVFTNAPVDVVMTVDGVQLLFDQASGAMATTGEFPYPVFPYQTPDGDWALWWVVPAGASDPTITFTATGDGTLHQAVVDPATGTVSAWVGPITTGQTAEWTPVVADPYAVDPSTSVAGAAAPSAAGVMRIAGVEVEPSVVVAQFDDEGYLLVGSGSRSPLVLVGGVLLLVGGLAAVFLLRRRAATPKAV